jgi:hypothetical protein
MSWEGLHNGWDHHHPLKINYANSFDFLCILQTLKKFKLSFKQLTLHIVRLERPSPKQKM